MEVKVEGEGEEARLLPLAKEEREKTMVERVMSQTFQSTAHLANLLPTGTVLAFQLLSPIFTNSGRCGSVSRSMSAFLVTICASSCFLACFTDSFKADNGEVLYGIATLRGLWVLDGAPHAAIPEEVIKYRLRWVDVAHSLMSVMVFMAVALFDQNVVNCFFPQPSEETRQLLLSLPVGLGVLCSMLFVAFPTRRHGIGFPITP